MLGGPEDGPPKVLPDKQQGTSQQTVFRAAAQAEARKTVTDWIPFLVGFETAWALSLLSYWAAAKVWKLRYQSLSREFEKLLMLYKVQNENHSRELMLYKV